MPWRIIANELVLSMFFMWTRGVVSVATGIRPAKFHSEIQGVPKSESDDPRNASPNLDFLDFDQIYG